MDARERDLVTINTYDILGALGWRTTGLPRRWLELLVRHPARRFADMVIAFDEAVRAAGLPVAAQGLLESFADGLTVSGAERIPARGPVLILSNHPGMSDTVALFAAVPRADLRIIAADRPFLRTLSAAARQLIFVPEGPSPAKAAGRAAAIRAAVGHLRAGGALLTFPAGEIEPDPAVLPGAVQSLERWSASTEIFLRHTPGCVVVPVVVSGVLSRRAQRHPLTRLRRSRKDREWLGAMMQIIRRMLQPGSWPVRVRVNFLEPFDAGALDVRGGRALAAVRDRVGAFLREAPPHW